MFVILDVTLSSRLSWGKQSWLIWGGEPTNLQRVLAWTGPGSVRFIQGNDSWSAWWLSGCVWSRSQGLPELAFGLGLGFGFFFPDGVLRSSAARCERDARSQELQAVSLPPASCCCDADWDDAARGARVAAAVLVLYCVCARYMCRQELPPS